MFVHFLTTRAFEGELQQGDCLPGGKDEAKEEQARLPNRDIADV